jgi:hypothetical protein
MLNKLKPHILSLVVFLMLFIAGFAIIMNSVEWGLDAEYAAIIANGGTMDSTKASIILQESISSYRTIGGSTSAAAFWGHLMVYIVPSIFIRLFISNWNSPYGVMCP